MDWIYLVQDGDKWRAVVKRVTKLCVRPNAEDALHGRGTVRFERRIISEQEIM